ncbi:MAG: CCXG family PEP-CTERM protein [bacterium]|nr:CCXG family PEP-CTERM protein [bacterium]
MFRAVLSSLLSLVASAGTATALEFRADFRQSTFQVTAGDTFSDLLAQHEGETLIQSNVIDSLQNVSTAVHGGGVSSNYSILMTTDVTIGVEGRYTFQVGTDWGRGGATALIDNTTGSVVYERVITDDVWWDYDWNNPDVFETTFDFAAGDSYTLAWVGFEGCCGGSTTLRFSVDGGGFADLTSTNFDPYVLTPEPSTGVLVTLGLAGLATTRRRDERDSA